MSNHNLRKIPSVDEILRDKRFESYMDSHSRTFVAEAVRECVERMRRDVIRGADTDISIDTIEAMVKRYLADILKPSLRRVVNASGTVLHTNLGRAVLCDDAADALNIAARHPVNLEFDLGSGSRGNRDCHLETLLCRLTGAEAATVVNNNAAAVLLTLNTLAENKDVIISRGELVEIGGSFRIPDVIRKSGCRLVEVGTTNRTHISDYVSGINPDTGLLLKVHTSNYRIVGFTSAAPLEELVKIGKEHKIPVVEDLGSGALIDLTQFGLPDEPVVIKRIEAGADVVTFSGDKLMGGPQAGIIAGRREYINRINKNPLKRALRVDKLIISALEATLKLYLNADALRERLPTVRFLVRSVEEVDSLAREAASLLARILGSGYNVNVMEGVSQPGSGSAPGMNIPTRLVVISSKSESPEKVFERFLKNDPPVIGRVQKDVFILDMRMVEKAGDVVISNFANG